MKTQALILMTKMLINSKDLLLLLIFFMKKKFQLWLLLILIIKTIILQQNWIIHTKEQSVLCCWIGAVNFYFNFWSRNKRLTTMAFNWGRFATSIRVCEALFLQFLLLGCLQSGVKNLVSQDIGYAYFVLAVSFLYCSANLTLDKLS